MATDIPKSVEPKAIGYQTYDRGWGAYCAGKSIGDCPYIGKMKAFWILGWKRAEEYEKEKYPKMGGIRC